MSDLQCNPKNHNSFVYSLHISYTQPPEILLRAFNYPTWHCPFLSSVAQGIIRGFQRSTRNSGELVKAGRAWRVLRMWKEAGKEASRTAKKRGMGQDRRPRGRKRERDVSTLPPSGGTVVTAFARVASSTRPHPNASGALISTRQLKKQSSCPAIPENGCCCVAARAGDRQRAWGWRGGTVKEREVRAGQSASRAPATRTCVHYSGLRVPRAQVADSTLRTKALLLKWFRKTSSILKVLCSPLSY